MTSRPGASAKSSRRHTRPEGSGREKSGASVPSAIIVDVAATVASSGSGPRPAAPGTRPTLGRSLASAVAVSPVRGGRPTGRVARRPRSAGARWSWWPGPRAGRPRSPPRPGWRGAEPRRRSARGPRSPRRARRASRPVPGRTLRRGRRSGERSPGATVATGQPSAQPLASSSAAASWDQPATKSAGCTAGKAVAQLPLVAPTGERHGLGGQLLLAAREVMRLRAPGGLAVGHDLPPSGGGVALSPQQAGRRAHHALTGVGRARHDRERTG